MSQPPESSPPAKSVHWAHLSEAGGLMGMRFLLGCFKLGGRPLFKLVLAPVILYFFVCRRQARQASLDYLRRVQRAGGVAAKARLGWLSLGHFWQFGNALVDKLAVWMGQISRAQVQIYGDEIIYQLRARQQGCLLVISHLGNFEICRCLSSRHPGMRLTVLMHTKHAQKFNRLMQEQAGASQVDIVQVSEITPATAMMLSERIERGEFVAIAGDRVALNNPENSLIVEFLGDKAALPLGPFTLGGILRAPMVSLFCLREGAGYSIYFKQLSDGEPVPRRQRQQHLQQLAQVYAHELERQCLRQPLQWFNFFDFWHLPQVANQPDPAALPQSQASQIADFPATEKGNI